MNYLSTLIEVFLITVTVLFLFGAVYELLTAQRKLHRTMNDDDYRVFGREERPEKREPPITITRDYG